MSELNVNYYLDFKASMHSNLFQGQMDRDLLYGPNNYGETCMSKQYK